MPPIQIRAAGQEAETNPEIERRFVVAELRASVREADQQPTIEGVAAVYNQETEIMWFREVIRPGAFDRVLAENPDVVGAFNHNWDIILGRTLANTLHLVDSPAGLKYVIDVNPGDPEAMSVHAKVQRGDIRQSSFAFTVRKDEWTYPEDKAELPLRAVIEVGELYDVSPVTFPAYPQTSASVRSKLTEWTRIRSGEGQAAPAGEAETQQAQARLAKRRRLLDLADKS